MSGDMKDTTGLITDQSDWCENYPDYVIRKQRMNKLFQINKKKGRFHDENVEGQWENNGDDYLIGITKESWAVTKEDNCFNNLSDHLNNGERDGDWLDDLPIDLRLDIEDEEEEYFDYDDDEF